MSKQSAESNNKNSGLLKNSKPVFLAVAKIFKPHGLRGEVSAELYTDFPERIVQEKEVYIGKSYKPYRINTSRKANKIYLISFKEHQYRDMVEHLRNKIVYIKTVEMPKLPNDEYYHHELLGLKVLTKENDLIGEIQEIIDTGANDVYVIKPINPDESDILIPAIKSVVNSVDTEKGEMVVTLPEWR